MVVAVYDLAESHLAFKCFGQRQRIEPEQQFIVFVDLVGVDKSSWDELSQCVWVFGRCPFDEVDVGFKICCLCNKIESISLLSRLTVSFQTSSDGPSIAGSDTFQVFDPTVAVKFGLNSNPIRILISRSRFTT
jgi:hypothetical protein